MALLLLAAVPLYLAAAAMLGVMLLTATLAIFASQRRLRELP